MAAVITAAADGSSLSNPGPSGWAWYIDDAHWAAGGWAHGTNNMGELMAVLDLLRQTEPRGSEDLLVLCDSQYVINSITKWSPGWKRRGWRKADGQPVQNLELLQSIDRALAGRHVHFEWVKGHAGHELNEAADARARAAATAFQRGLPVDSGPGFDGEGRTPAASPMTGPSPRPEPAASLFDEEPAPDDIDEVLRLERSLLDDGVRSDRDAVADLLHPEFVEVGRSGRIWTRGRTLAGLAALEARPDMELLGADRLADDVVLLRWRASDPRGETLRSSVWQRTPHGWRQRYHQATPVAGSEGPGRLP